MIQSQNDRLVRISEVVGNPKHGQPGLLPISRSAWWAGVKDGRYPQPIKLGAKTTCWKLSSVLALLDKGAVS